MKTCLQPLCVTAEVLNNAVTDECLRMYKSLGFLRLPRYPMLVDGTNDFEIEREPQYEEEWVNGVENEKMFLTRFDKIFWNENVCALSACL